MKLVHVFTAPQSAYYFLDGQLEFMQSKGIDVLVVIPSDQHFNEAFVVKHPNIRVRHINFSRQITFRNDLSCLFKLIKLFKTEKPDIIHLHTPKASLLGVIAGKFLFKKNIIYQMHGLVSARGNTVQKGILYRMEKLTCILATQVFAVSKSLKDFAIENKVCKADKITVIENGTINGIDFQNRFNPENITKDESVKNLINGRFTIGYVGRLSEEKGIFDYIKVLAKLKQEKTPFTGFIIGPDESEGEFKKHLKRNNLEIEKDVYCFGEVEKPEHLMIHLDVLLLPTKREGFGLVGAEANSLEIPVVGYDIPGFKDAVLNEETGFLVEYGNTDLLFEAAYKYYENPTLRKIHGRKGRERVIRDFNSEKIWKALLEEYKRLLKEKEIEFKPCTKTT